MPAVMPGRAVAGERPLGQVRQGAAALQGPQRPRLLLRPDARGGHHRPRAARGALVPRAAAEPLPDPDEVPRRDAAALRAHARARVHHEGRLLVPRRRRRTRSASTRRCTTPTRASSSAAGSTFRAVEADTGAIGGDAVARVPGAGRLGRGRDRRRATRCGYAANVEKAEVRPLPPPRRRRGGALEQRRARPGKRTIDEVAAFLGAAAGALRQDAASTDGRRRRRRRAGARRSRGVSETKLQAALGGEAVALADEATVRAGHRRAGRLRRARSGSASASSPTRRCAACAARSTGANATDEHLRRRRPGARLPRRRASPTCARRAPATPARAATAARSRATAASRSARSSTSARSTREPMGATFLDADGQERPIEMGCYGIGVTRTVAAAIEQNHDDDGIIWPLPLAPFARARRAGQRGRRDAARDRRAPRTASSRRAGRRGAARRPRRAARA